MKRPNVRLAWREKAIIFWLIMVLNGVVIFYIIAFGHVLCPDYDKAWDPTEVSEHTGTNDYYAAVQRQVYEVSKFINGQRSDIQNEPSNSQDALEQSGLDLTYYFLPPLTLAFPGLVNSDQLYLTAPTNWTEAVPTAMHILQA